MVVLQLRFQVVTARANKRLASKCCDNLRVTGSTNFGKLIAQFIIHIRVSGAQLGRPGAYRQRVLCAENHLLFVAAQGAQIKAITEAERTVDPQAGTQAIFTDIGVAIVVQLHSALQQGAGSSWTFQSLVPVSLPGASVVL